jgi:hypothetical protein
MDTQTPQRISDPLDAERALLAALCQLPEGDSRRAEIFSLLANYPWRSIDHRIIWEILAEGRLGTTDLPARFAIRLTQLGFPDLEYEFCFAACGNSVDAALVWLRERMSDVAKDTDAARRVSGGAERSSR